MFKHHFLVFFRSLIRQKTNSIISLSGIVLGLTAVLLAYAFIADEQGFDAFHTKADRIFRVNKTYQEPSGGVTKNAETPGKMAPTLDEDFPEVEAAAHYAPWFQDVLVSYDDQHIEVDNWAFADSNFFRLFDFEILRGGHRSQVLAQPGQVLLTPALAQSLFGDQNPVGKTVKGVNDKLFTVSGILAEAPRQSHIQYDAIASWASTESGSGVLDFSFMNNWLGQTVYTYVMLRRPGQMAAVNEKLPAFTEQYMSNRKDTYGFYLQPLNEIYLQSDDLLYLRSGKYGSATFLRTFSIIALLILLIACFNYINITTARSLQRAKEVGVKKVLGAGKGQLVRQFLTETFALTLLASFAAFALAQFLLPQLNNWFGKDIPNGNLFAPQMLVFLLAVVVLTSVISGLFPGLLLSRFRPISILRSSAKLSPGGEWPRQVLTTVQLTISVGLIAGTLLLHRQFQYLLDRDLGFDKEQVMVLHTPPGIDSSMVAFRQSLVSLPGVTSVSICNAAMPDGTFGSTCRPEGTNEEVPVQMFRVDSNYLKTYGIEMAEGRFLNRATDFDPGTLVVNEAMLRQMGWEEGVGKTIKFMGDETPYPVVGVVKDFHYSSLHQPVKPLVMYLDQRRSNISVRLEEAQLAALLPNIEKLWRQFEARHPFDYYFLDTFFAENYLAEKQMVRTITLFSALAIFIACLGLYGLASFAIARRRKEIGVRKVLGATVSGIVGLLTKNFLRQVGLALLIATPVVWYFLNNWLANFTYHVPLSWWVFGVAGLLMVLIVLLTVSFQSFKAASANPVNSLRSE
ncbi:MAG: ABC transporter permease [Bacteroidota bacterium]